METAEKWFIRCIFLANIHFEGVGSGAIKRKKKKGRKKERTKESSKIKKAGNKKTKVGAF
jgi:hypothetical protein